MKNSVFTLAIAAGSSVALAGPSTTIDFNSLAHGEIITTTDFNSDGLTLTFENPNRSFDIGAAFDTTLTGTADPDLEDPWSGGNIASDTILGNVVIIAENDTGAGDGILDTPDDEASRPAGRIIADFDSELIEFGLDIIDIEGAIQESSSLEFYLSGNLIDTLTFSDLMARDASVVFGNNSANSITPITSAELGSTFDRVIINVGGSSAYDNFTYVVPSPGALAVAGLGGLVAARRRR